MGLSDLFPGTLDESRTIQEGTVRITTVATPLSHAFDTQSLAEGPADAIATGIQNGIRSIGELARSGQHRLFNRTGGLADGIESVAADPGFAIMAPDGYLQDDALYQRLVDLVPAIADPSEIPELTPALEATLDILISDRGY